MTKFYQTFVEILRITKTAEFIRMLAVTDKGSDRFIRFSANELAQIDGRI